MRVVSHLVAAGVAGAAILGIPALAAAQPFTLTGRLVEQFPGGGAIPAPEVQVFSVSPIGEFGPVVRFLEACEDGETTDCIDSSGSFTATNLEPATYKVRAASGEGGFDSPGRSVAVNSNTNMGDLPFLRLPFSIEVQIADIPAGGGTIPVTVRGRKQWPAPALPVIVRVEASRETQFGFNVDLTPTVLEVEWPTDLMDTGVVPLTTLDVVPTVPAGAQHCVNVQIRLQSNPAIVLGGAGTCKSKLP